MSKKKFLVVASVSLIAVVSIVGVLLKDRLSFFSELTTNIIAKSIPFIESKKPVSFGSSVLYVEPTTNIDSEIAKDFDVKEIQNIEAMQNAYGFTFSSAEQKALSSQKFVMKSLLDTSIRPGSGGDNAREFSQLYQVTMGSREAKSRGMENTQFYSTDVFLNSYANLYTELLKEMENTVFYPSMKSLSKQLFEEANKHVTASSTEQDKKTWMDVRNYFAVPYALFETSASPLTDADYQSKDGTMRDPENVLLEWKANDEKVDTVIQVNAFVKGLKLDTESEKKVMADVTQIFDASGKGKPKILETAYTDYAVISDVDFFVDFSQFTPRATYTSSSLRREYFRALKWYIMLPFFVKSPELTTDAYAISQLLAENPEATKNYNQLEAAITFMVGTSDDLSPTDYLAALASAKGASDKEATALQYLINAHNPKIKDLAADYKTVGTENSEDVRLKTKGLRFFSGTFIIDSYWTGFLTQGDEAIRKGYTQKLPPMASMLEVMSLLGSDYAKSQIPKLDFYKETNKHAINQAMGELEKQHASLTVSDWQENLYTSWLWTIQGLFGWQKAHHDALPPFMQSPNWSVKTLQTAAAFWTELRHATILYAKQSFSEMGGAGEGVCDTRTVPPPPKSYIEPNLQTYARLSYLAKRTDAGLKEQGYVLKNMVPLESYISLMDHVSEYTKKELGNTVFQEEIKTITEPDLNDPTKKCTHHEVVDGSDWETLRVKLTLDLVNSIPVPVEGPLLPAKDRRATILADVHTGGDSVRPLSILYEGEGVPYVIFVVLKDANGPRLSVGFVSSHYEFTKLYGGKRMTDEDWQKNFYEGDEPYDAFSYTTKDKWPSVNKWFESLLVK